MLANFLQAEAINVAASRAPPAPVAVPVAVNPALTSTANSSRQDTEIIEDSADEGGAAGAAVDEEFDELESESDSDDGDDSDESDFVEGDDDSPKKKAPKRKGRKPKSPKKKQLATTARPGRAQQFAAFVDVDSRATSIGGEFDDFSASGSVDGRGARRSTRPNKPKSRFVDEGADDSYMSDESAGYGEKPKKKPRKSNASTPAYDDEDELAEDHYLDVRPQDQHRIVRAPLALFFCHEYTTSDPTLYHQTCFKCEKGRVPDLLREIKARKSKPGRKRRPRKSDDDLEEDTDQEEDRVRKLGAWMECNVWYVSA